MAILQLIIRDKVLNKVWKTPDHNKSKAKDDFHREVKEAIKKDLSSTIKKRIGNNFDVKIENNSIIIRSTLFGKDGKRQKMSTKTDLKPEYYFEEVLSFLPNLLINNNAVNSFKLVKLKRRPIIRIYIYV